MGWLEFVMKQIEYIDTISGISAQAWRHQIVCKLLDAGVTDPEEIKNSVNALYEFVVSQSNFQNLTHPYLDTETLQVRLEGILHGKTCLDRLASFVYLLEDEKRALNQRDKR